MGEERENAARTGAQAGTSGPADAAGPGRNRPQPSLPVPGSGHGAVGGNGQPGHPVHAVRLVPVAGSHIGPVASGHAVPAAGGHALPGAGGHAIPVGRVSPSGGPATAEGHIALSREKGGAPRAFVVRPVGAPSSHVQGHHAVTGQAAAHAVAVWAQAQAAHALQATTAQKAAPAGGDASAKALPGAAATGTNTASARVGHEEKKSAPAGTGGPSIPTPAPSSSGGAAGPGGPNGPTPPGTGHIAPGPEGPSGPSGSGPTGPVGQEGLRPSDVDFMPGILRCLSILLRLKGVNVSPQFLLAGLTGSKVTPEGCLRVARKAGLTGRILYRKKLEDIPALTLPCLLILTNDRACVLTAREGDTAEVIFPETDNTAQKVPLSSLAPDYSGYVLFASVDVKPDARTEGFTISRGRRWFWDVLGYYAPIYRQVAVASVITNLIAVATPLFVMNVYDRVVPNAANETLWVLAIGVLVAHVFGFLLRSLRTHFVDVAGRNADVVLSSTLVNKVLSMRLDAKPESTGALTNNLREFEQLREFFSSSTLLACIDVPFLVVFVFLMGFIGGPLCLLPVAVIPLLLAIGLFIQGMARRAAEKNYKQNMQKNALLVEIVGGLETIKACQAESRMQRLWEAVVGLSAKSSTDARRYNSLAINASLFLTQLTSVIMIIWGVYRIEDGLMTMGALIGCNILLGRTMAPLMQVAGLLTRFQNSRVALTALDLLMALPSENEAEKTPMDFGLLRPTLAMENVSFAYPREKRLALDNVSLRIEPGERVGIIGPMGSGKSTLGKLLTGLYQPKEGAVKFGGVDIRQFATTELRSRVGMLPQDVVLFYGTVRDNIALGDPTINDHLILRAATIAGVADFLRSNPSGFAAQVGEQGKGLSGGQRQAVALARALVHDPEILILDEPTSNMDVESERILQARLAAACRGRTLILVTHRLSMLRMVDRLIVMKEGRIAYDGPRDACDLFRRRPARPQQPRPDGTTAGA